MLMEKTIWVVGHSETDADKSYSWNDDIPNITDADIVILDLSTMTTMMPPEKSNNAEDGEGVQHMTQVPKILLTHYKSGRLMREVCTDKLSISISQNLDSKILAGGHVIYLMDYNYMSHYICDHTSILIDGFSMQGVASRDKILHNSNHRFKEYLEKIKNVHYVLKIPDCTKVEDQFMNTDIKSDSIIHDNSNKIVGATVLIKGDDGSSYGKLTFLPAILPSADKEMINKIILELRGTNMEPPPPWINNLEIVGLTDIKKQITNFESQKNKMNKKILELEDRKKMLGKYGDLLYATGVQLEESVKTTFKLLGFNEINKKRGEGKEDWRIDLKSIPDVKVGVLEVKGRNKKTTQGDLVQCNKWVDDYLSMEPSTRVKGIFISNQFRLQQFPKSRDQRKRFEPNELEYAKTRNICIIPTYVLFESVNKALSNELPDRSTIEQLIFNTNGVLTQL